MQYVLEMQIHLRARRTRLSGYSERACPQSRNASSDSFRADSTKIAKWRLKDRSVNDSLPSWATLADGQAEEGELSELQNELLEACAVLPGANQGRTGLGDLLDQRQQQGQGGFQQRRRDQRAVPGSQPRRTGDTFPPLGTGDSAL